MIGTVILDLLYPPRCMLCHKLTANGTITVCDDCAALLLRQSPLARRENGKIFSISPYAYEEPLRSSIHRFKFRGRTFYSHSYGEWMAACVRSELTESFDFLTWVPVSPLRHWQRGYDQAKLLCGELSKQLQIPMVRALRKVRHNPPQSGTDSAETRKQNVKGVYRICGSCELKGKTVLLVDDVTTTGATLHECVKILKNAGAARVCCVTLAATI